MSLPIAFTKTERPATPNPWVLSDRTLTVFYGCPEMPRLSHYFLPRLLFAIRPCADRSHARSPGSPRSRSGRYLLGARRNGRASGDSICGLAQTPQPRCDSFRVGRLDYSSVASPAGRTLAIFSAAQSRRVRGCPAIPRPQLHELRKDSFQSQLYHALWPHPRGQAELVHFREVRLRPSLGAG